MIRLLSRPRQGMVCRQAVELVSDYLDGGLPLTQRRRLEAHLARCPDCPEYLTQMRAIIAVTGSVTPDDLTPRMRSELIGPYRRWLADEG